MPTQEEKAAAFRALHEGEPFVIPNPWDAGSARVLDSLGFKALATTSGGIAFSAGRLDGFYERGLERWDWAAGHLLIEEAGGAVGWLDGDPAPCGRARAGPRRTDPVLVAAATPELLDELLALAG